MSTDERVTKELVETLEDGRVGFEKAAERLRGTDRADLASQFQEISAERGRFAEELRGLAASYGDEVKDSGTVAATVHRGWMAVKDQLSGSDAKGVLSAAEQGEDHAVREYKKALENDEISPTLRTVIERQYASVKQAHDFVRDALRLAQAS